MEDQLRCWVVKNCTLAHAHAQVATHAVSGCPHFGLFLLLKVDIICQDLISGFQATRCLGHARWMYLLLYGWAGKKRVKQGNETLRQTSLQDHHGVGVFYFFLCRESRQLQKTIGS